MSGVHFLVPLEAELFDLIDTQAFLFGWVSSSIFLVWLLALLSLFFAYLLSLGLAWARFNLLLGLLGALNIILVFCWVFLFYDLALNSLSAWAVVQDYDVFYQHPRTGSTYCSWVGPVDVFD